jgi:hypothetical protein
VVLADHSLRQASQTFDSRTTYRDFEHEYRKQAWFNKVDEAQRKSLFQTALQAFHAKSKHVEPAPTSCSMSLLPDRHRIMYSDVELCLADSLL